MRSGGRVFAGVVVAVLALASMEGRAAGGGSSVFLCYTRFAGAQAGVWPYAQAESLYRPANPTVGFYFRPYALEGNMPDGTNLGSWHLACSLPSPPPGYAGSYGESSEYIGGSGEVYDRAAGIAIVTRSIRRMRSACTRSHRLYPCGCSASP